MSFKDYREFIAGLEKTGDVIRIKQEVDWDLEAGAIARRGCELGSPAPFFEKVKDYPEGYRLFANTFATYSRLALALGLKPDASFLDICSTYETRCKQAIKPIVVKDAACKENKILNEAEVDFYRFPVPMIHEGDGGRYLGTWHITAAKDPDSDWINWGMYRHQVYNRRYAGCQHFRMGDMGQILWGKYVPKKQHLPCAIAIGSDPLCDLASMAIYGVGESEADYAGGLHQEPVEVVACETIPDLLVPARSEIIIEGEILCDVSAMEGPFGEYSGYRVGPRRPLLVFRAKAITHRTDPIFIFSCLGMPTDDNCITKSVMLSVRTTQLLREHRLPITMAYHPPQATGNHMVIVGVKKPAFPHIAAHIGNIVHSLSFFPGMPQMVIVVDEEVDVLNFDEVIHALATRCHPGKDILIQQNQPGVPLTPYLSLEERLKGVWATVTFDCTFPPEWPKETELPAPMSFNQAYPKEIRDKVLANWSNYGFK